jgi:NMD protein affecting ribosome stability and mRNA decay
MHFRPMKDEWNETIRCPICGKTGIANLCQEEDAETPIVQHVPSGFRVVSDQHGPDFHCETCHVAVNP